jgi:hypothetical protein
MLNVVIEIFPEETEGAKNRGAGHVDEGAITFASVELEDLLELIEQRRVALSFVNPLEHCCEHRCFHPARRALTARFTSEELRNAQRFFSHARSSGVEAHHTTA